MAEERKCEGLDPWQVSAWIHKLGSFPVERVAHVDHGAGYTKRACHILKLENKRYALVSECGCSCYESADAEIDLHPDKKSAMRAFEQWKKDHPQSYD